MPLVTTADDTQLYVNDWGEGRPVVLIHGWPLTADSWESQALTLAENGYRVVAYDRRGFGRSTKPFTGYDYDTMADDLRTVIDTLELKDVAIAGFSMGGGEVSRYMSRHAAHQVKQAALLASVAPYLLKTDDNPDGAPASVFEDMKAGIRKDRPAFFRDFFNNFYGQDTDKGGVSDAVLDWAWTMAMMASPKATLDCIDAFGKTDFRPDMEAFNVPTLIVHGTGDKVVPIDATGRQAAKMIKGAKLEEFDGAPHGLTATHASQLNKTLLAFLKG